MTDHSEQSASPVAAILPGLILVITLTLPALWLGQVTAFPAVITALILGLCASPLFLRNQRSQPGIRFAA
ncbi:MAG: hypothetical protein AAF926_06985, partial [Pseudomonadota bacterium]